MRHNSPPAPALYKKEGELDVSVIIVNWNTQALLRRCLASLAQYTRAVAYDVWVVDNGSTDGSSEMVRQEFPTVRIMCNTENVGFAKANNQALPHATGRYLLLLNSDTALLNNALQQIVQCLDAHPTVGMSGPRLLNADGSRQESCDLFPRRPLRLFWEKILDIVWPANTLTRQGHRTCWDYSTNFPVDYVIGAALCIRRQTFEAIGLLDEQFFMYAEDIDWCYRAARAGWPTWYLGECVVYHYNRGSSERTAELSTRLQQLRAESLLRFYHKHYGRLTARIMSGHLKKFLRK